MRRLLRTIRAVIGFFWCSARNQCPIHKTSLLEDEVPLIYGLVSRDRFSRLSQKYFYPEAKTEALGGCLKGDKTTRIVNYCPECRKCKIEWGKLDRKTRGQRLLQILRIEDPEEAAKLSRPPDDDFEAIIEQIIDLEENPDLPRFSNESPKPGGLAEAIGKQHTKSQEALSSSEMPDLEAELLEAVQRKRDEMEKDKKKHDLETDEPD